MNEKRTKRKSIPKIPIKKILVPLDGSTNALNALKEAINLSKFTNSQIVGIYVIPKDISSLPLVELLQPLSTLRPMGFQQKIFKHGLTIIKKAKEMCEKNKIKFTGQIINGNPGYDIVRFSKSRKNEINLIVMGSRGKGPTTEIFLGSTSNYVIHKASCPVIIVK